MHKGFGRSSNLVALVGLATLSLGLWQFFYGEGLDALGRSSIVVGLAVLFLSFALYVRAKGYPAWWCLLFFMGGGFWILWILPDRTEHGRV